MRMLRDFKALSFQSCANVSFLHNVSTYYKSPQLSHIVCYKHFIMNTIYLILGIVIFFILIFSMTRNIKCPKCGKKSVNHSHAEKIGNTDKEIYECNNCNKKFV